MKNVVNNLKARAAEEGWYLGDISEAEVTEELRMMKLQPEFFEYGGCIKVNGMERMFNEIELKAMLKAMPKRQLPW